MWTLHTVPLVASSLLLCTLAGWTRAESEDVIQEAEAVSVWIVFALCAALVARLFHVKQWHAVPESVILIIMGVISGLVLKSLHDVDLVSLGINSIVLFLIPPIIFYAGFSVSRNLFLTNIGSILMFAIFGTIITALTVALAFFWSTPGTTWQESLAVGAIESAIDPVAVLAVFRALPVDPLLNILVFGEAVVNDAVSVVLYSEVTSERSDAFFLVLLRFFGVCLGSVAFGLALGLLTAFMFKKLHLTETCSRLRDVEIAIAVIMAYLPYMLCEFLGLSAIMCILVSGMVFRRYCFRQLSIIAQTATSYIFKSSAVMAEGLVFVGLGMGLAVTPWTGAPAQYVSTFAGCIVGRALNIFPLSWLANHKRAAKITMNMQIMMFVGGLRGAIAYAVSLEHAAEHGGDVVPITLVIAVATVCIFGTLTYPLVHKLKVTLPEAVDEADDQDGDVFQIALLDSNVSIVHDNGRTTRSSVLAIDYQLRHFFTARLSAETIAQTERTLQTMRASWLRSHGLHRNSTIPTSGYDDLNRLPLTDRDAECLATPIPINHEMSAH